MNLNSVNTQVADIVLFKALNPLGGLIRRFEASPGDKFPVFFNHVGQISFDDTVIEALTKVVRTPLSKYMNNKGQEIMIVRRVGITVPELTTINTEAESYLGKKYGYQKIALHLGDYYLSRMFGTEVYLFRRLCLNNRYPICSWVTAWSFSKAGFNFGVAKEVCNPDDIQDCVFRDAKKNSRQWQITYCTRRLFDQIVKVVPEISNQIAFNF